MKYFINKNGKMIGPGTIEEMRSLLACHFLLANDLIQRQGETEWHEISALTEFGGSVGPQPGPELRASPSSATPTPSGLTKVKGNLPASGPPEAPPRPPLSEPDVPPTEPATATTQLPVPPPQPTGRELARKTQIRLIQRITPAVYISWALALGVIWILGYFLAVKIIERKEHTLAHSVALPPPETIQRALPVTPSRAETPVRPVLVPTNEPRVTFPYTPDRRSLAPRSNSTPTVPAVPAEEAPVFEAHLLPADPGSRPRSYQGEGPMEVRNVPFRNYDLKFVQMIRQRWIAILEEHDFVRGKTGRVLVEFRLNPNGQVANVQIIKNELNDLLAWLCQKAVLEGGPYGVWPTAMRLRVPEDYRIIRFTFYYE